MSNVQSTCTSPPAVPADPMSTGIPARLPARSIRARSCLIISRGNADFPEPNEYGPASVVPASAAMKWGFCAIASSRLSPCMPPPTAPIAAMNLISSISSPFFRVTWSNPGRPGAELLRTLHSSRRHLLLPYDLGPKLDLARRSCGGIDNAGTTGIYGVKYADSIELQIIYGRLKVCVVQDIEEFKTQLQANRL